MSDLFPALRGHARPGDSLGRVYTPLSLATSIVAELLVGSSLLRGTDPLSVVEPSVGEGAFVRAVRLFIPRHAVLFPGTQSTFITGVDIDPAAAGLTLCDDGVVGDWPKVAANWEQDDLCIVNPPYHTTPKNGNPGVPWSVPISHVCAAVKAARVTALILPVVYLCQSTFRDAVPQHDAFWPIIGRPWPRVREVGVFVWGDDRKVDIRWKE